MSGFHRSGRHRVRQARNAVRCSAGRRTKGVLNPTKNRLRGVLRHLVRAFLHTDDSFERLDSFSEVPNPSDSNRYTTIPVCNCLVDVWPYTHCAVRPSSLCGGKESSTSHNMVYNSTTISATAKTKKAGKKKETVPWLSSSRSERRVFQGHHQPASGPVAQQQQQQRGKGGEGGISCLFLGLPCAPWELS